MSRNERKRLEALAGDEAASDRLRDRARIMLAASAGQSNAEIAQAVGIHPATVRLWRSRWLRDGIEGLQHKTPVAELGRRMGRPLAPVVLDDQARQVLERWTRRSTVSAGLALRARIVLAAAAGATNVEVADALGCSTATVAKWRSRSSPRAWSGCPTSTAPGGPAPSATTTSKP